MVEEIITEKKERLYVLDSDCVIQLHNLLSNNYHLIDKLDAIEPPGLKSQNGLESSVLRQKIGVGNWLKYECSFQNCATLVFGLIKNHAFNNGNKRVAFLSMIKHLYENGYVIKADTKHQEIYKVLLAIADNCFKEEILNNYNKKLARDFRGKEDWSDETIILVLARWLKTISESKNISQKSSLKIQKLKEILTSKNIDLTVNGKDIKLYQIKKESFLGFKLSDKIINVRKYSIGTNSSEINVSTINKIRKDYALSHSDGYDNKAFYYDESFIDKEMTTYKQIIYKLSLT